MISIGRLSNLKQSARFFSRKFSEVVEQAPVVAASTSADAASSIKESKSFKKKRANRPVIVSSRERDTKLEEKATKEGLEWRIVSSCILFRPPTIRRSVEKDDPEYYKLNFQESQNIHEQFVTKLQSGGVRFLGKQYPTNEKLVSGLAFTPAETKTKADEEDDVKTLNRRYEEGLFLIVKRNRQDNSWQFPQGKVLPDEPTLRKAADRVLERAVGPIDNLGLGRLPVGHFLYEYPQAIKEKRQQFGAKVFYHISLYNGPDINLEGKKLYSDYAWIGRNDLGKYFPEETAFYLSHLLP